MTRSPQPVSRNPQAVRDRILDAAQAEFMAAGYAAASTNRILERFGGSKPTMFRHYPSKRAMFAAVVGRIASRWRHEIAAEAITAADPATWLTAFGTFTLRWILSEENIFVGRMAIAEGAALSDVGDLYRREAVEPIEAALSKRLAEWHEEGILLSIDPRRDAVAFLDLTIAGEVSRRLYGGPPLDVTAVHRHVDYCVALFLHGRLQPYAPVER